MKVCKEKPIKLKLDGGYKNCKGIFTIIPGVATDIKRSLVALYTNKNLFLHKFHYNWILTMQSYEHMKLAYTKQTIGPSTSVLYSYWQWVSKVSGIDLPHHLLSKTIYWRCQGLNFGPSVCFTDALPMNWAPHLTKTVFITEKTCT